MKLTSYGEVVEDKLVNQELEAGLLLEFKKDPERVLLAVTHRPDGKKNWMVFDQVLLVLIHIDLAADRLTYSHFNGAEWCFFFHQTAANYLHRPRSL